MKLMKYGKNSFFIVYKSPNSVYSNTRSLIVIRPNNGLVNELIVSFFITKNGKIKLKSDIKIDERIKISGFQTTLTDYHFCLLFNHSKKWYKFLVNYKNELIHSETFKYDVMDIVRQILSELFQELFVLHRSDTNEKHQMIEKLMLEIIDDIDKLMSLFEHTKLLTWLKDARSWGEDEIEKNYFEFNARNLITRWGPRGEITDYASREWNGLMKNYYKKRWQLYFDNKGDNYWGKILDFEKKFEKETIVKLNENKYEWNDIGEAFDFIISLFEKYFTLVECD